MNKLTKIMIVSMFFLITVAIAGRLTATYDVTVSDSAEIAYGDINVNEILTDEIEGKHNRKVEKDLHNACNDILNSGDYEKIENAYDAIEPYIPTVGVVP